MDVDYVRVWQRSSLTPTLTSTIIHTLAPNPGDANDDGKVDGIDYITWLNHYNQTTPNKYRDGDFNGDGKVDRIDYSIWLTSYTR